MSMTYRFYKAETDYVEVATWWVDRTKVIPSKSLLSEMGIIVENDDGVPLAFVSLYGAYEGQKTAFLGFPATNPKPGLEFNTHKALMKAIKVACVVAASRGIKNLLSWTDVKAVDHAYKEAGFLTGSEGTLTDYAKVLR